MTAGAAGTLRAAGRGPMCGFPFELPPSRPLEGEASALEESPRLASLVRFDIEESPRRGAASSLAADGLWIAGIDEAGRGALAGPLVVGCVSFGPMPCEQRHGVWLSELRWLDDSKRVTPRRREQLFAGIARWAAWAVGWTDASELDAVGVTAAATAAAGRALAHLSVAPELVLLDGGLALRGDTAASTLRSIAIVHGDRRSMHIAAASIVAKVVRDRMMRVLAARYGGYGFERNKGYGTAGHLEALQRRGVSPVHRRSFRGVVCDRGASGD